jgi:hypothetical protein
MLCIAEGLRYRLIMTSWLMTSLIVVIDNEHKLPVDYVTRHQRLNLYRSGW